MVQEILGLALIAVGLISGIARVIATGRRASATLAWPQGGRSNKAKPVEGLKV